MIFENLEAVCREGQDTENVVQEAGLEVSPLVQDAGLEVGPVVQEAGSLPPPEDKERNDRVSCLPERHINQLHRRTPQAHETAVASFSLCNIL